MFCAHCGASLPSDVAYCPSCGARAGSSAAPPLPQAAAPQYGSTQYGGPPYYGTQMQPADFGVRFGAWLIDSIIVTILGFIGAILLAVVLAVAVAAGQSDPLTFAEEDQQNQDIENAAIAGAYIGYLPIWFAYMWISNATGGGPGKRMLGLRIVKVGTEESPGAGAGLGRTLVGMLSGIFYIGYLWALWDKEKRTWHDHAAGTTVVRT